MVSTYTCQFTTKNKHIEKKRQHPSPPGLKLVLVVNQPHELPDDWYVQCVNKHFLVRLCTNKCKTGMKCTHRKKKLKSKKNGKTTAKYQHAPAGTGFAPWTWQQSPWAEHKTCVVVQANTLINTKCWSASYGYPAMENVLKTQNGWVWSKIKLEHWQLNKKGHCHAELRFEVSWKPALKYW